MSNVPEAHFFTKQHEWIRESDGEFLVGITDYAQHSLGDIVFVDCKPLGSKIPQGESLGSIESVKAAEDFYAPVSGEITAQNEEVQQHPEKVNADPYGSWLVKLKDVDRSDLDTLMDSSAYEAYLLTLAE